jgi:hypothetical protein
VVDQPTVLGQAPLGPERQAGPDREPLPAELLDEVAELLLVAVVMPSDDWSQRLVVRSDEDAGLRHRCDAQSNDTMPGSAVERVG